jgi:hypothetical protein
MARDKTVRLSEQELQALKNYRDNQYVAYVPLGQVINDLVEENRNL